MRCESVLLLSLLVGPAQTGPSPMLRKHLTGKGAIWLADISYQPHITVCMSESRLVLVLLPQADPGEGLRGLQLPPPF